jgi:uncharacterized protein YdeI (YjbR/CyaY-like superfamily)
VCILVLQRRALLKDPKRILERIGEHTQATRWTKFTSLREITVLQSTLRDYLYEAIVLEESSKKIELKKPSEYAIPEELQSRLDDNLVLRAAFQALTPGRREVIHLLRLQREAGKNQGHAGGKVRTDDPERARVQRAAELRLDSSEASLDFSDITTR